MKRTSVRYAAVAAFLLALLGVTYALQAWRLARIDAQGEAAQVEAVAHAARAVEHEIRALEGDLMQRAEALARLPAVRLALQDSAARDEAVRVFSELRLPEGVAAELYTPTPELLAWNGPSMPFGLATRTTRFLSAPQTSVARDGALRQAVVVWLPIREGRRVRGAVRMLQLVKTQVPVRNQYLRDFDLAERWAAQTGIPVEVTFGAPSGTTPDSTTHLVRGQDETVLAQVMVPPPTTAMLQEAVRREMSDVAAFWGMLLVGWVLAGLWMAQEWVTPKPTRTQEDERLAVRAWGGAVLVFTIATAAWWGLRYTLLSSNIPARWFAGASAPAGGANEVPLFDPIYLASGFGGGVLGSAGELVITAVFAVVFSVAWLRFAFGVFRYVRSTERAHSDMVRPGGRWAIGTLVGTFVGVAAVGVIALLIRRATLDATLPYFDRTDALPSGMVLLVFGSFLLLVLAALLILTGIGVLVRVRGRLRFMGGAAAVALALATVYATTPIGSGLPWPVAVAFFAVGGFMAWWMERGPDAWAGPLTLRGTVLAVLVLAALTYPIAYEAAKDKQEARIADAAEEFADGEDARVAFALEGVLLDARASGAVRDALAHRRRALPTQTIAFDSLATDLVTGSLLAALADYTVGLTLLGPAGDTLGVYREVPPPGGDPDVYGSLTAAPDDPLAFSSLRRRYAADTAPGFVVERASAPEGRGKYRYAGVGPIRRDGDGAILGWVTAQAEPKPARYVSETLFPRVLVPAGLSNVVESDLAFAEFRDGVLVRARGDDYGRFRLPAEVRAALQERDVVWRNERVGREPVRVYYRRFAEDGRARIISVREPGVVVFDHLYFYLRLLLPALALGLVAYALGVAVRRRAGVLLRRSRLRDRVLNRFLLVGVASVVLTGLIGQQVVMTQNRQSVQDQLKRRLARVEAELFAEATPRTGGSIPLYQFIDRARPDVVGPRLGLDVNLYRGAELIASSRSQLIRQQLIDRRLPADVYEALYVQGERYAFAEERIGTFTYTTGYEVLPDEQGRPGAVIAIPTLPEQSAIEADQARMIAYLFGVLLLLLVGIFLTTTLLANRLTRPFRRLRAGLLAVGAGEKLADPIPVESSDEVGELIETFNAMRYQLEESRRKLAQQERELAWREMARQVAHEIKNPLTPMKLSVQHLRRAHREAPAEADDGERNGRFSALLDRITTTLIEQIDALTRIANEFSRFARLPSRHLERLDLNAVIREAAALIGEEEHARIALALADEPLPVEADREELRRVYINLFKNALQAMPEDERGTVTVRTEQRTDPTEDGVAWAFSAVRDTGTGIPEEARLKVFQPNFSTKTSGMGLGLAITKKAVEDLRGEIHFETTVGVGTTFFVRLPLADEAEEEP